VTLPALEGPAEGSIGYGFCFPWYLGSAQEHVSSCRHSIPRKTPVGKFGEFIKPEMVYSGSLWNKHTRRIYATGRTGIRGHIWTSCSCAFTRSVKQVSLLGSQC